MLSYRCLSVLSCPVCPVCDVGVLWPNGWTDQYETWHAGRPRPRRLCVRSGSNPLPQKGGESACPIFGPRLLWPNCCMDQNATWYGGRPRPTRHCVRCGPSYPQKKGTPTPIQFLTHVCCGHGRSSQLLLSSCLLIL